MAVTACRRCSRSDAAAAWSRWWAELDTPVVLPPDAGSPMCPACWTPAEQIAFLAGLRFARPLIAERHADVPDRVEQRLRVLLVPHDAEAAS